jgi:hypothetical protein
MGSIKLVLAPMCPRTSGGLGYARAISLENRLLLRLPICSFHAETVRMCPLLRVHGLLGMSLDENGVRESFPGPLAKSTYVKLT